MRLIYLTTKVVFLGLLLVYCQSAPVLSQTTAPADIPGYYKGISADFGRELAQARDVLEQKGEENWQIADIQEYLRCSLYYVFYGKIAANFDGQVAATNDIVSLASLGYLDEWPLNPFDNWEPMAVVGISDGFAAGALCLDLCPPSYYSREGTSPVAASFNLFIYGPNEEFERVGYIHTLDENEWTVVPTGAIYGSSYYVESIERNERRYEWLRSKRAEAEERETDDESQE